MDGLGSGVDAFNTRIADMQEYLRAQFGESKDKMDGQFLDVIQMVKDLKDTGDLDEQMKEESNQKFLTKLTIWLKESGIMLWKVILILYIPICWYLITRKGYTVGGTNLNSFPYRDPNTNQKSFNQVAQLYKQAGGGGKFNILGPYKEVSIPYEGILDTEAQGFNQNIRLWAIDSFAGSIATLRFILSFVLAANRDLTGYDSNSSNNFLKFILAIPVGYILTIVITLMGLFLALAMNILTLTVKIKDYWWPFAGTRLFSGATWIFILMLFGLFAPYSSFIFLLITAISSIYTLIQQFGLWIFIFGAPFTYMYRSVKKGDTGDILKFVKSIMNGVFWVYMYFVLFYPTKIIWGGPAMTGGLVYLIYLLFTNGPNIFK